MMMFAEYGARVRITDDERYPSGTAGTIANDGGDIVLVDMDGIGCDTFAVDRLTITMAPSEAAYRYTSRFSVDEMLEAIVNIVSIGAQDRKLERYQSALIYELYRLNHYAELRVIEEQEAEARARVRIAEMLDS